MQLIRSKSLPGGDKLALGGINEFRLLARTGNSMPDGEDLQMHRGKSRMFVAQHTRIIEPWDL